MKKKIIFTIVLLSVFVFVPVNQAHALEPIQFLLVPIEQIGNYRGPEYLCWRWDDDLDSICPEWGLMDYGFTNYGLVVFRNTDQDMMDFMASKIDVYIFPENMDTAVTDPNIDTFYEGINLPADWLTPSTTYRELLRQTAGIFQFNQAFGGYCGTSLFDSVTLDDAYRDLTTAEQACFNAAAAQMGIDPGLIKPNVKLRSLVKAAGTVWEGVPFYIGGVEF